LCPTNCFSGSGGNTGTVGSRNAIVGEPTTWGEKNAASSLGSDIRLRRRLLDDDPRQQKYNPVATATRIVAIAKLATRMTILEGDFVPEEAWERAELREGAALDVGVVEGAGACVGIGMSGVAVMGEVESVLVRVTIAGASEIVSR
jgi:hypothetical protein